MNINVFHQFQPGGMPQRGPRGDWNRPPGNMHQGGGFQGKKFDEICFLFFLKFVYCDKILDYSEYIDFPHAAYMRRGIYEAKTTAQLYNITNLLVRCQ